MKKISPYIIIVGSFFSVILIGTILLSLPISVSNKSSLKVIDAFFISSSAVTITGLSSVTDLSVTFSIFGKMVLVFLIQIGGLSIVTVSVFIMYLVGIKIGLSNRILIKESLNQNSLSGLIKLARKIVIFTFIVEFIGFIINLAVFLPKYETLDAIGISIFHAVSSFNNAGFDILGPNSLQNYNNNILLNVNTMLLIMIGGIGFIVINDIIEKKSYKKLMLYSKVVIIMNLLLWIFGTILLKISQNRLGSKFSWLEALFLSVSARTAGFANVNMALISPLATMILIMLMFIGASPSSTGGGIKTTTIYTVIKSIFSYAKGKQVITHNRLIGDDTIKKAGLLFSLGILFVFFSTAVLLFFEDILFDTALFEVVSAFANVGLTKNLTVSLSNYSKILISILMLIGRVGPLTFIGVFNRKWNKKDIIHIEYIEENIMIG